MSPDSLTIEPLLSAADREELSHLEYLLARLMELKDRGLIAADSYATVVAESQSKRDAIERQGSYQAAMKQAMMLVKSEPETALKWAEHACDLDPSRIKPWELLVSLNWNLEQDDRAIGVCVEAAKRFPKFQDELARLEAERVGRAEIRQRKAEQARQESELNTWLAQARTALDQRRDRDAIAVCGQILQARPQQTGALAVAAYAHQRLGEFDEALSFYEMLSRLQPANASWPQWIRHIQLRRNVQRLTGKSVEETDAESDSADGSRSRGVALPPPPLSWSSFAGAFLEEHWQKLILCLAVLLIVVSSTVGAGLVLGTLALVAVGQVYAGPDRDRAVRGLWRGAGALGSRPRRPDDAGCHLDRRSNPLHACRRAQAAAGAVRIPANRPRHRCPGASGAGAWCQRYTRASGRCAIPVDHALALEHRQRRRLRAAQRSPGIGSSPRFKRRRWSSWVRSGLSVLDGGARPTTSIANSPTWSWVCSDSHWWPAWCVPGSTPFGWRRRFMASRSWSSPSRSFMRRGD